MTAPDHEPFLDALAAAHDDPARVRVLLGVFADYLDEHDDPHGAAGAREAARRGWRPNCSKLAHSWVYWAVIRAAPRRPYRLPQYLWDELRNYNQQYILTVTVWYESVPAAWAAYLAAFRRACESGRWPRPKRKARATG